MRSGPTCGSVKAPSGGAAGSPAAGAWCSRRGRCQGSTGGQWNPGAAAAAEAAVSAVRPRPPAPSPRGSPGGKRLLRHESPLPGGGGGVPSATLSRTAYRDLGSTTKLPSWWELHPEVLHPFPSDPGSFSLLSGFLFCLAPPSAPWIPPPPTPHTYYPCCLCPSKP